MNNMLVILVTFFLMSQINLAKCNDQYDVRLSMILNATLYEDTPIQGLVDSLWVGHNNEEEETWHLIDQPEYFTPGSEKWTWNQTTSIPLFETTRLYLTFIQTNSEIASGFIEVNKVTLSSTINHKLVDDIHFCSVGQPYNKPTPVYFASAVQLNRCG